MRDSTIDASRRRGEEAGGISAPPQVGGITLRERLGSRLAVELLLWAFGGVFWMWFLLAGTPRFTAYDWPVMHQLVAVTKMAFAQGRLPFYAVLFPQELTSGFWHGSDRLLADPQLIVSPQIILLPLMSVRVFIITQLLLMYTIGHAGLCVLARKARLSSFSLAVVFITYSLSGYFTAKIGVGHLTNSGFFLWPWVVFFCWRLFEAMDDPEYSIRTVAPLVVVTSATVVFALMQGSMHIYFHMMLFLSVCAILNRRALKLFGSILVLSTLMGAFRTLPIAFASGYTSVARLAQGGFGLWYAGYASKLSPESWISGLAEGLTVLRGPRYLNGGSYWELNSYIGLFAVMALVGGVVWLILNDTWRQWGKAYVKVCVAGTAFLVLSLGPFYSVLFKYIASPLGIPVAERIPSRLIVVPLLLFIITGAHGIDGWLSSFDSRLRWATKGFILAMLVSAMMTHASIWRVATAEKSYEARDRGKALAELTFRASIEEKPLDRSYLMWLMIGSGVSLVTWTVATVGLGASILKSGRES